jgi:hypothetical protein
VVVAAKEKWKRGGVRPNVIKGPGIVHGKAERTLKKGGAWLKPGGAEKPGGP